MTAVSSVKTLCSISYIQYPLLCSNSSMVTSCLLTAKSGPAECCSAIHRKPCWRMMSQSKPIKEILVNIDKIQGKFTLASSMLWNTADFNHSIMWKQKCFFVFCASERVEFAKWIFTTFKSKGNAFSKQMFLIITVNVYYFTSKQSLPLRFQPVSMSIEGKQVNKVCYNNSHVYTWP